MIIAAAASTLDPPHVDLLVDALPAGTTKITIYRSYGGVRSVLRDANNAATGGASSRPYSDYDVPFGVATAYSAYAINAAGAQLAVAQSAAVTINSDKPWISDPLAPARACKVDLINESLDEIAHDSVGAFLDVLESDLPIASMGVTQAASSFVLKFLAPMALIGSQIRTVLNSANPFLLRCPPDMFVQLPALCYVARTSYSDLKIRQGTEHDHIVVNGCRAVASPGSPTVIQTRTYASVRDEASNYGDLPNLYPRYLELLRGY